MRNFCRVCGSKEKLKYTKDELKRLQRATRYVLVGNLCVDCEYRVRMYNADSSDKSAENGGEPGCNEDELIIVDDDEHFYSMLNKEMRMKKQQRTSSPEEPVVVSDDDDIIFTTIETTPRKRKITYDENAMIVVDTVSIHSSDDESEAPKKYKSAGMRKNSVHIITETTLKKSAFNSSGNESSAKHDTLSYDKTPNSHLEKVTKRASSESRIENIMAKPSCSSHETVNENAMLTAIPQNLISEKSLDITMVSSSHKLDYEKSLQEATTESQNTTTKSITLDNGTTAKKSEPKKTKTNDCPKKSTMPDNVTGTPTLPKLVSEISLQLAPVNCSLTQQLPSASQHEPSAERRTLSAIAANCIRELDKELADAAEPPTKISKQNMQSPKPICVKKSKGSPKESKPENPSKDSPKKPIKRGRPRGTFKVKNPGLVSEMRNRSHESARYSAAKSAKGIVERHKYFVKPDGKSAKPKEKNTFPKEHAKISKVSAKQNKVLKPKEERAQSEYLLLKTRRRSPKCEDMTKLKRKKNSTDSEKASSSPKETQPFDKDYLPSVSTAAQKTVKSLSSKQRERTVEDEKLEKKLGTKTSNDTKVKHKKPNQTNDKNIRKVANPMKTKVAKKFHIQVNAASKKYKTDGNPSCQKNSQKEKQQADKLSASKANSKDFLTPQTCPECQEAFSSVQQTVQHIRLVHPEHKSGVLKLHSNNNGDPLTQRLRYRKKFTLYECTKCSMIHSSYKLHLKHIVQERRNTKQQKKSQKQMCRAELGKPKPKKASKKKGAQPIVPTKPKLILQCKFCELVFCGFIKLNQHYLTEHQVQEQFKLKSTNNTKRKIDYPRSCESLDINSNRNASPTGKALENVQV